jgi:hypothetical protein
VRKRQRRRGSRLVIEAVDLEVECCLLALGKPIDEVVDWSCCR